MQQLELLNIRPDDPEAQPISDYFVNKRIELLLEEAKSFRMDYRNETLGRNSEIFLADKKSWLDGEIPTVTLSAMTLGGTILISLSITSLALIIQNRKTR